MKPAHAIEYVADPLAPRDGARGAHDSEARIPSDASENLDLVSRFIGRGDPVNSLWFVGLEESATFEQAYLATLRERERSLKAAIRTPGGLYWQTVEMMASEARANLAPTPEFKKLLRAEARMRWELDREPTSNEVLDEYAHERLWRERTFHCNLYSLGYQRRREFPPQYAELFGIASARNPDLIHANERRLQWLRELVSAYQPAAVICLGLEDEAQFAAAVGASANGARPEPRSFGRGRRLSIYRSERTIVMQHLSRAGHAAQRDVVRILRDEWRISL